jgi:drug/metabolite transporter (DMT)-like permease
VTCQVLMQQLFTVPVFFFSGAEFSIPGSVLAIMLGSLQVIPSIYYLRAIQEEEISRVTALEYLYIIFVFLGAGIFMGESLALRSYVGGFILVLAVMLMSYKNEGAGGISAISPALKHFYFYWIFTAFHYLAIKYLLSTMGEFDLYCWSSIGNLIMVLPMLAIRQVRSEASSLIGKGPKAVFAILSGEAFQFMGIIFSIFAYASGSVALVTTVGALEPLVTLISTLTLSIFKPGLIDEDLGRDVLLKKVVSILMVALGIYLIC